MNPLVYNKIIYAQAIPERIHQKPNSYFWGKWMLETGDGGDPYDFCLFALWAFFTFQYLFYYFLTKSAKIT